MQYAGVCRQCFLGVYCQDTEYVLVTGGKIDGILPVVRRTADFDNGGDAGITGAGTGRYYLLPEACTFLEENARKKVYPYSMPPASREYSYGADNCPNARDYLESMIRWSTFCEKYQPEHCELAADIISQVADRNRR